MNPPNSKLTPLQALTCEKMRLMKRCDQQEQLIGAHLDYIHQHAGTLMLKGVSSILFPKTVPQKANPTAESNVDNDLGDYFAQIKGYMPMVWEVVRPLLITWGVSKFRKNVSMLLRKL